MRPSRPPRIVLFPYGQPKRAAHRELCAEVCLKLEGDLQRIMDGPFPSLDAFLRYARRIDSIAQGTEQPIVVLTDPDPLETRALAARSRMELALPGFRKATWVLFADLDEAPAFVRRVRELGELERAPGGLIWTAPGDKIFLVLVTWGAEQQVSRSWSRNPPRQSQPVARVGLTPPPQSGQRAKSRLLSDPAVKQSRRATTGRGKTGRGR